MKQALVRRMLADAIDGQGQGGFAAHARSACAAAEASEPDPVPVPPVSDNERARRIALVVDRAKQRKDRENGRR